MKIGATGKMELEETKFDENGKRLQTKNLRVEIDEDGYEV